MLTGSQEQVGLDTLNRSAQRYLTLQFAMDVWHDRWYHWLKSGLSLFGTLVTRFNLLRSVCLDLATKTYHSRFLESGY